MSLRHFYSTWISPQRWLERAGVGVLTQIVLGLILLSTCVLLFAQDLKFLPNADEQLSQTRTALAENVSRAIASAISRQDYPAIQDQFDAIAGHDGVLSACLRRQNGSIVAQTQGHAKYWTGSSPDANDLTHLHLALSAGDHPWGRLEIAFTNPPDQSGWREWWNTPIVRLMTFVICAEFLFFWLYLSRMLRAIDPSAVIPDRMQLLIDTLVEGIVILDQAGHVVMVNQAFAQTAFCSTEQLIGRKLSLLPWLAGDGDENASPAPPWESENRVLQLRGIPMRLRIGTRSARRLNVNVSPISGPDAQQLGLIITFDDQTVIEEDNRQLSLALERFSDVGSQIEQLCTYLPATAHQSLHKLQELSHLAVELGRLRIVPTAETPTPTIREDTPAFRNSPCKTERKNNLDKPRAIGESISF